MKLLRYILLFLMILAGFASTASALSISPGSTSAILTGNQTSNSEILQAIDAYLSIVLPDTIKNYEVYKDNNGGTEEGPLAGSYDTSYANGGSDATITYVAGMPYIDPATQIWLLVKDGNQLPAWYFYELAPELGWNGMETIYLSNFWEGTGAISHVALYSKSISVPEPVTMLLIGTGLIGLGIGARRRIAKKT